MSIKITMLNEDDSPFTLPAGVELVLIGDGVELAAGRPAGDGTIGFDVAVDPGVRLALRARPVPVRPAARAAG